MQVKMMLLAICGEISWEPLPDQQQTVNIRGHNVNIPPIAPSTKGGQGKGEKGSHGHGKQSKGTWVPVLPAQQPVTPENRDMHVTDGSRAPSMFSSSSSYNPSVKGGGKDKGKEGKSRPKSFPGCMLQMFLQKVVCL